MKINGIDIEDSLIEITSCSPSSEQIMKIYTLILSPVLGFFNTDNRTWVRASRQLTESEIDSLRTSILSL